MSQETQIAQAISSKRAILVTGAGFSAGATDKFGQALPIGRTLAKEIWPIAFGDIPYDDGSSLGEIFRLARNKNNGLLRNHLELVFHVEPTTLPHRYLDWYALPWYRIYTLNIDNLDQVVDELTPTGAELNILSARRSHPADAMGSQKLAVVHLNGDLHDYPDVTFDPIDFGMRSALPDAWYEMFVNDIVSRPVIFVGTALDEPPLWHYLSQRGIKGPAPEMRPKSWFVTKSLPAAKKALLKDFNIELWEGWEPEFHAQVIAPNKASLYALAEKMRGVTNVRNAHLIDVAEEISKNPSGTSDFLLGFQPDWGDVFNGYSVEFEWDTWLLELYEHLPLEFASFLATRAQERPLR